MVEPKSPTSGADPEARPAGPAAAGTFGATVGVAALSLLNVLLVSRLLGPEGRGELVFLMTVAGLTGFILTLSVQEANANFAGQQPHSRPSLATNSVLLALLLGAIGAGAVFLLGERFPGVRGGAGQGLTLIALAAVPIVILQNYLMLLARGVYAAAVANVALLIPPVLNVGVNAAFGLAGWLTVTSAVVTWVVSQGLSAAALTWYVQRRLSGFGRPDLALGRRSVTFGLKSHGGGVMAAGNFRLDQWLLGSIAGSQQLGLYSIAVAWAEALFFVPQALALALRPHFVHATPAAARSQAMTVVRYGLIVTVPLSVGILLAAPFLCVGILGSEFEDSVEQLRLLVPGAFGIVVLKLLGNALVAQGRPLLETAGIGVSLVFTVALDIVLIPKYGGTGAAIASSVAYTVGGIAVTVIFLRTLGGSPGGLLPRPADFSALAGRLRALTTRPSGSDDDATATRSR